MNPVQDAVPLDRALAEVGMFAQRPAEGMLFEVEESVDDRRVAARTPVAAAGLGKPGLRLGKVGSGSLDEANAILRQSSRSNMA